MEEQNIALNRPTSASSFVKPYESARAVNGSSGPTTPTSRWLCNSLPGWLMVDLGVNGSYAYWINRWVVRHMTVAGWRSPDYNMCDFKLQGSNDNNTWYDIDGVVGNTVGITDRTFTAVAYRYVRLYVTKGLKCNVKMASAMELEVYQSPPLSAYLQSNTGLTVGGLTLNPSPFVNNVFNYTTPNVANNVTFVAVKPTAEDSRATIKVNGVVVTSGNTTNVTLNVGSNAISVQVTAADGRTTNTYTVTVVRDAAPVAELSAFSINPGKLNETFSPSTLAYTANVGFDVQTITVTPTTNITGATITVNGTSVTSGNPSGPINLNVGNGNVINIVVTNGTATKTYTVTVTRVGSSNLMGLSLSSGTLQPGFSKDTTLYSASVSYDVASINVTPTAEDGTAVIKVNGQIVTSGSAVPVSLNLGDNQINVIVTGYGVTSKTYTVNVTKPANLFLTKVDFKYTGTRFSFANTVNMDHNSLNYATNVAIAATQVTITPTAENNGVSINVNGQTLVSGGTSTSISIPTASTQIFISVSYSGVTGSRNYVITITKC